MDEFFYILSFLSFLPFGGSNILNWLFGDDRTQLDWPIIVGSGLISLIIAFMGKMIENSDAELVIKTENKKILQEILDKFSQGQK